MMMLPELTPGDWQALTLTLMLASVTTLLLLPLGTPLAWWLAFSRRRLKIVVEALVALPLVLPPTVIGFYLLVLFAPQSTLGGLWKQTFGDPLPFSFA
ncbi:MAG: molybdate ABC transporter permease subunit, partial [Magnetococcales bacterium]|nr:molybdate ABC transporter permease subunit [Magnetococcales bacterium]